MRARLAAAVVLVVLAAPGAADAAVRSATANTPAAVDPDSPATARLESASVRYASSGRVDATVTFVRPPAETPGARASVRLGLGELLSEPLTPGPASCDWSGDDSARLRLDLPAKTAGADTISRVAPVQLDPYGRTARFSLSSTRLRDLNPICLSARLLVPGEPTTGLRDVLFGGFQFKDGSFGPEAGARLKLATAEIESVLDGSFAIGRLPEAHCAPSRGAPTMRCAAGVTLRTVTGRPRLTFRGRVTFRGIEKRHRFSVGFTPKLRVTLRWKHCPAGLDATRRPCSFVVRWASSKENVAVLVANAVLRRSR